MKELVNLHTQPLAIEDGTILAAAGTEGSAKTILDIPADEEDAKAKQARLNDQIDMLIDRGLVIARDSKLRAVPPQQPVAPKPAENATDKIAAADDAKGVKK